MDACNTRGILENCIYFCFFFKAASTSGLCNVSTYSDLKSDSLHHTSSFLYRYFCEINLNFFFFNKQCYFCFRVRYNSRGQIARANTVRIEEASRVRDSSQIIFFSRHCKCCLLYYNLYYKCELCVSISP